MIRVFSTRNYNGKDDHHAEVSAVAEIAEREPIVLPIPAITEVTYLLQRDVGIEAVATFLKTLPETDFILKTPTAEDYRRAAAILRKYNDANIDFVDAVIAAIAERLNITKILTVDRRHFGIFKPAQARARKVLSSRFSVQTASEAVRFLLRLSFKFINARATDALCFRLRHAEA